MDILKNWAFSVCIAALCGTILNLILPEGGAKNTYKTVFCIFFLCVLSAPLSELEIPDFESLAKNIEKTESEAFAENEFSRTSVSIIEEAVLDDTKYILAEYGITAKDISIKINISENGSIDINKFALIIDYIENLAELKEKIFQKTGIMPEIIISEEN